MKFIRTIILVATLTLFPFLAKSDYWMMFMDAPSGWTTEDGNVTVTYSFQMNPTSAGAYPTKIFKDLSYYNIECSDPNIIAKIKNNSEDFIYLDLGKTYILRNGEAELFQNITTMSTTTDNKEEDATKKSLAQSVMPIPPHSTKTLIFPIFDSQKKMSGYEPYTRCRKESKYGKAYISYYCTKELENGKSYSYNQDNSPMITTISLAYTDTEGQEKPTHITKEFHLNQALKLKHTKDKELLKAGIDFNGKALYIIKAEN